MSRVAHYMKHPFVVQRDLFQQLVQTAAKTDWGKRHNYRAIKSYHDFRKQVPVQDYESLKPYIERMMYGERNVLWPGRVKWFSKSSGTTSDKSKYIPVPYKNLYGCHLRSGWDACTLLYNRYEHLKIFEKKNLVMGGSVSPFAPYPETLTGDVSAIMLSHIPKVARPFYTPDIATALNPDMEEKIDRMARILPNEDVSMIGGVPTWVVVLFRKMLEYTGKDNILDIWPNFEVYMHGGVSFKPYREQFKAFIPKENFIYQEIYNATEGFFAAQDQMPDEGMLLLLNNGMFFEFLPPSEWGKENPEAIPLEAVETGQNYAIVISTNAGLWRYTPGDTVMFTSIKPYRIKVTGRTKQFVNAFGEEVMVENTDAALAETCYQTGAIANEYTVAPVYFNGSGKGSHEWLIEFEKPPENIEKFRALLDRNLQKINSDYEAKRYRDMALQALTIKILPKGSFINWMRARGKYGGQNKVPRLANHRDYIEEILQLTGNK